MAKLVFNGLTSNGITLKSYNRNTSVDEQGRIVSTAYAQLEPAAATATYLTSLLSTPITRIQIRDDANQVAYDLNNINATLTNISESWNGESVDIYINIDTGVAAAAPASGD